LIISKPTLLNNRRNLNRDGMVNQKEIGLKNRDLMSPP